MAGSSLNITKRGLVIEEQHDGFSTTQRQTEEEERYMWVAINTDKLACMLELIPLQDCNNDDARGTFRIKDAINNLPHQAISCTRRRLQKDLRWLRWPYLEVGCHTWRHTPLEPASRSYDPNLLQGSPGDDIG